MTDLIPVLVALAGALSVVFLVTTGARGLSQRSITLRSHTYTGATAIIVSLWLVLIGLCGVCVIVGYLSQASRP